MQQFLINGQSASGHRPIRSSRAMGRTPTAEIRSRCRTGRRSAGSLTTVPFWCPSAGLSLGIKASLPAVSQLDAERFLRSPRKTRGSLSLLPSLGSQICKRSSSCDKATILSSQLEKELIILKHKKLSVFWGFERLLGQEGRIVVASCVFMNWRVLMQAFICFNLLYTQEFCLL